MNLSHSSRKDRFRPHFCDSQFYHQHQSNFEIIKSEIISFDQITQITIWTISLCCLRRPRSWFNGYSPEPVIKIEEILSNQFSIYNLFQKINISWPKKIPQNIELNNFLKAVRIVPLPEIVHLAFLKFFQNKYPLEILCYEPTSKQLLQFQIEGRRVLTFNNDFLSWPTLRYGERDPLSFWIHDLIHAEHFFSDTEKQLGQINFYRLCQEILKYKLLDDLHLSPEFVDAFSYLISDMNSHPVHLIKTLKAIINIHQNKLAQPDLLIWKKILNLPICSDNVLLEYFQYAD